MPDRTEAEQAALERAMESSDSRVGDWDAGVAFGRVEFAEALLTAWGLAGGECEHGRGMDYCPFSEGETDDGTGECAWNEVRPALRAAHDLTGGT